jgi:predicted 3-demethylubiquinone-9 3-methyltransferase (glyoxalase superfamily)
MPTIQKIVPCLWFDNQAEEAATFYVSIFERSRIARVTWYGEEGTEVHGKKPGSVLTVAFELEDQPFTAINGGPHFKFNEAVSLQVMCNTQSEIDRYWEELSAGGEEGARRCGWLKDRFGLSWQIVPRVLIDWIGDGDPVKAGRVMKAMLQMKKLDIAKLKEAFSG